MTTIKPFTPEKGYTKINNDLLDYVMPNLPPNAWKVLCFIIRKTKGWHKEEDQLSISQIKDGVGIGNRTTVSKAIRDLEKANCVIIYRSTNNIDSNTYILNTDLTITIQEGSTEIVPPSPKAVPRQNDIEGGSGTEIVPGVVQKSYPQKKGLKKSTTNVVGGKPPKTEKQKKSQEMFSALTEACQIDLATIRNGTRGKFNQAEKRMRDKGYTPDDIKEFGDWWYLQDWRGKQGQPPTLELIRDCWGQFLRWRKNGKAPRASPNHANDLSSQQLEQIREFNQ